MNNRFDNQSRQRVDFDEVKRSAEGRYHEILSALCPEIKEALDAPGKSITCPLHGGENDFRMYKDYQRNGAAICSCRETGGSGISLIMALRSWTYVDTMYEIAAVLWGEARVIETPKAPPVPKHDPQKNQKLENTNRKTWSETLSLLDPRAEPALRYLARRGISSRCIEGMEQSIRFHPELAFYEDGSYKENLPAIIARVVSPEGKTLTLHRIYLDSDSPYTGKAKCKKMRPYPDTYELRGAAIRIGPPRPIMAVAEGIETALAIREATGLTVWSLYSESILRSFIAPQGVRCVMAFGDRDQKHAGEEAVKALSENNTTPVCPFIPGVEGDSVDWGDVLVDSGISGFSSVHQWMAKAKENLQKSYAKAREAQNANQEQQQPNEEHAPVDSAADG